MYLKQLKYVSTQVSWINFAIIQAFILEATS